jgi:hypothetical protein
MTSSENRKIGPLGVPFGTIGTQFDWAGTHAWDDCLEVEEAAKLLGLFYVRNAVALEDDSAFQRSLWPRPHVWLESRYDTITWSPAAEAWFKELEAAYSTEDPKKPGQSMAQPKTSKQWSQNLHEADRATCHVWIAARHQAARFLEEGSDFLS